MASPVTLTAAEASTFLKNVLQMPETENGNKVEFLNGIIVSFKAKVPCHNISLLSGARKVPDWTRVKSDILAGKGELGCALNVFLVGCLRALNFNAILNTAVMYALDAFHTSHVIVLVQDLTSPGDCFLVDVGNEYPTLEAIPLSFQEESPVYHHSYLEYKFMSREGRILRLHNRGQHDSKAQIDASLDGFYIFYDFDLSSKSPDDLAECFSVIYTNPRASPFHKCLRASIFPNGACTLLKDTELLIENQSKKLVSRELNSADEVRRVFTEHFPMIEDSLLTKALGVLKIT